MFILRGFILHTTLLITVFLLHQPVYSQNSADVISEQSVTEIMQFLSSNKLKGRVNYTMEQLQAADFINEYYRELGLETFYGMDNYSLSFDHKKNYESLKKVTLNMNKKKIHDSDFLYFSALFLPRERSIEDFTLIEIQEPADDSVLLKYWNNPANTLIWIKKNSGKVGQPFDHLKLPDGLPAADILVVYNQQRPTAISVSVNRKKMLSALYNIVGVLPGKTRNDEAIIFSAHYDHIATSPFERGGIFNGANDNASGTTALLQLATYFATKNDNERTLIFCAFAGEELVLRGSYDFSKYIRPEKIVSVVNLEMLGVPGHDGKGSVFITGAGYSDLDSILKNNFSNTGIRIVDEPFTERQYFFRSDNYPFAQLGIPAHSIMASTDDDECYHRTCDDFDRIDIENLTLIIRAVARGCETIISGKDTPARKKMTKKN